MQALSISFNKFYRETEKSFMMDVTRTQEVWNQAVYKFESQVLKERNKAVEELQMGLWRKKISSPEYGMWRSQPFLSLRMG